MSLCFIEAGFDPNVQVGAILKQLDGNYRIGNSEYLILEACEYVESFLHFRPKAEIILNIDNDHLDYFKNLDNIKNAFRKYVELLPEDGLLVINSDDKNSNGIDKYSKAKCVTYGIENKNANFIAKNIEFDKNGFASFDVYRNGELLDNFKLSIAGRHNVLNRISLYSTLHKLWNSNRCNKESFYKIYRSK